MGIFDIFSDQPAKDAAAAQTAGLNRGYDVASGDIKSGISSLTGNYGAGIDALRQNFGAGAGALNTNYTAALQPYMTNYGQAQGGVNQLGNVLGVNGPGGSDQALNFLRNTPGYQFQLEQGNNAINAQAAATGMNASGNQALALSKFNQGLADTTYNNYVSQLQPFLGASNAAAGGIANVNTGLGSSLASNYAGLGSGIAGVDTGLGNATANQYNQLGQLGYATQTGIGNANANADLAGYNASGNFWNMLGGIGGMKTAGGGSIGGNAVSGIGSAISSFLPAIFSDERLKEDIEPVGELFDGQPVYKYRYIGDNVIQIGLMAQDVEKTRPDAVVEIGGYKAVDYGKATEYAADLSRFLEAA